MSIVSPGISHAFRYSVPPPHRIDVRLFRCVIREGVFAKFAMDLVDFQDTEYFRQICDVIRDLSKQHVPVHDLHFRGMDEHFLQFAAFTEDDVGAEHVVAMR